MINLPEYQKRGLNQLILNLQSKYQDDLFRVLLFGSYAKGRARNWSDLDIAVECKVFNNVPWLNRIKALKLLLPRIGCNISPLGITSSELSFKYPTVLRTIHEQNIQLWPEVAENEK